MPLCYPLPTICHGVRTVRVDDAYLRQFPDMVDWLNKLSSVSIVEKKTTPLKTRTTTAILMYTHAQVREIDLIDCYKDYGWGNHVQDGVLFTKNGDGIKFLFRDGIIYSTFSDTLVCSCPGMDTTSELNKYLIFLISRHRGFIDVQNLSKITKGE